MKYLSDTGWDSMFLNLSLFSFGALALLFSSGYSVGPFLIIIFLLLVLPFKAKVDVDKDDLIFSSVFILFFTVGVFDTVLRGQSVSNLDLFSRYLLGAFVLFYLSQRNIKESFLLMGFAVGAIGASVWALYAKFILDMPRVKTEHLDPVNFGNISLLMGLISLTSVFWALEQKKKPLAALMLLAFFCGMTASLLSGSRSGWVALPLALFALYKIYEEILKDKVKKAALVGFVAFVAIFALLPDTGVQHRISLIFSDIEHYTQGHSTTSIGLRFEMWRSAYEAIIQKPVFGWGEAGFYEFQANMVEQMNLNPMILDFKHLHNQYIEELAKRGVIGLVALLLVFIVPFKLFYKKSQTGNKRTKPLAAAGVVVIICMADFCLTQGMLRITSAVMFFVFTLVFIWCCIRALEKREISQSPA